MNKLDWLKKRFIGVLLLLYPGLLLATTYGYVENVRIDKQLSLKAKLDTGARQSSLSAKKIRIFEKHKKKYVSFQIPGIDKTFVRPFIRYVHIKARAGEKHRGLFAFGIRRPVVSLQVSLGHKQQLIHFNLTNRESFNYPVLLGRDALIKFRAQIDPRQTFTHKVTP